MELLAKDAVRKFRFLTMLGEVQSLELHASCDTETITTTVKYNCSVPTTGAV